MCTHHTPRAGVPQYARRHISVFRRPDLQVWTEVGKVAGMDRIQSHNPGDAGRPCPVDALDRPLDKGIVIDAWGPYLTCQHRSDRGQGAGGGRRPLRQWSEPQRTTFDSWIGRQSECWQSER
jgi:hypothetical protein